jgi:hypothetical protein
LAFEVEVPIMHPDEMLAEKTVAWWLFGHAKHYNDIAFLAARLMADGREDLKPELRGRVRALVERKIDVNKNVSAAITQRIAALNPSERRRRLEEPDEHVEAKRGFNTLSYLHGNPPSSASVNGLVQRILIPILFD